MKPFSEKQQYHKKEKNHQNWPLVDLLWAILKEIFSELENTQRCVELVKCGICEEGTAVENIKYFHFRSYVIQNNNSPPVIKHYT